MSIKVGINGFGRIGRNAFRVALERDDVEVVAINDLGTIKTLAHLLKYDSVFGMLPYDVEVEDDYILVKGKKIKVLKCPKPEDLPWAELGVDVVIESTGRFRTREQVELHIKAGAKKVIVSAPSTGVDTTIVMGVNETTFDPVKDILISNASCTTNCLAPVLKVLEEKFGIEKAMMTTVHSYTNDQRILDLEHSDLRRARAAALSQIPTTTGAAKVIAHVLPSLTGKVTGMAVRVPTPDVSLIDVVAEVSKKVTPEEINEAFKEYAEGSLKGILGYCDVPLVSSDFKGTTQSAIVDSLSTTVLQDNMVKVLAWYDNEFGYSNRIVDVAAYVGKNM